MTFAADMNALLAVAGVTTIVGEKIYPGIAPQNTAAPYVVWRRNGGDKMATLGGASRTRQFVNVLVYCCAEGTDYDQAAQLGDAVRDAIAAGSSALKGTCNPPVDGFEPETRLFSVIVEALLFHRG